MLIIIIIIIVDASRTEWQTAAVEYPACDDLVVEAIPLDRNTNSILYLQNIEVRKCYYLTGALPHPFVERLNFEKSDQISARGWEGGVEGKC